MGLRSVGKPEHPRLIRSGGGEAFPLPVGRGPVPRHASCPEQEMNRIDTMFTMLGEVSGYRASSWPAKTVPVRQKPNPVNRENRENPAHDLQDVGKRGIRKPAVACQHSVGVSKT